MSQIQIMEYHGLRVLTSKQIAEAYKTDSKQISQGFNRNKGKFKEGKHFFMLRGSDLKAIRLKAELPSNTSRLYLWTDRGALLMAKIIDTDVAWEAYERLVDFYFQAKEAAKQKEENLSLEVMAKEQKLIVGDEKVLAYNRGVVLGVFRQELEEDSTLEIYERLSTRGKGLVMKLIFGEICHAE